MHVLLDHISAVLVASVLFVSIFTLTNRNRQNAVEMQIGQIVQEQAYAFSKIIERDLENIRSNKQVINALGSSFDVKETCKYEINEEGQTEFIRFATLESPNAGSVSGIVFVEYHLEPADTVITIQDEEHEIFKVTRYRRQLPSSPLIPDGGSAPIITHFDVRMYPTTQTVSNVTGLIYCPEDGELNRPRIEFQAAMPGVQNVTSDQRSTSNLNVTRFGATVYSPNR